MDDCGFGVSWVSEGARFADGKFLADAGSIDAFGHAQLGGVAPVIANMVKQEHGYKYHWAVADYLQRAARHIASKIAAGLKLCQLYDGKPSKSSIVDYADELAVLLRDGYVSSYEFGFKQNEQRVVCWRYDVRTDGSIACDDNAGKLFAYAETDSAVYYNYMSYTTKWFSLSASDRDRLKAGLPI